MFVKKKISFIFALSKQTKNTMKKLQLAIALIFASVLSSFAQEGPLSPTDTSYWKKGGSLAINFNNTSLTNWAAGGQSSVSLGSIIDLYANYNKGKDSWVNTLNWAAGASRLGDNTNLIKKSDDLFILFSKYRRNVKENWGFAAFAELRTQLLEGGSFGTYGTNADGSDLLLDGKREFRSQDYISHLLSPGYLTTSIGWEYSPNENFYLHATPLSGRATFLADDKLAGLRPSYGLELDQKYKFQLGALVRTGWKTKVMDNVDFSTTLQLFSPYEKFGNIDVTWETLTSFKINKFLSTTFATQLLYFDASLPKIEQVEVNGVKTDVAKHGIQFKHVLNIGFLAKF